MLFPHTHTLGSSSTKTSRFGPSYGIWLQGALGIVCTWGGTSHVEPMQGRIMKKYITINKNICIWHHKFQMTIQTLSSGSATARRHETLFRFIWDTRWSYWSSRWYTRLQTQPWWNWTELSATPIGTSPSTTTACMPYPRLSPTIVRFCFQIRAVLAS
jgi:hypothetical protein